ncbi:hypothetical protein U3516DRAFT_775024 [Neocallimastix sp. 'constans']
MGPFNSIDHITYNGYTEVICIVPLTYCRNDEILNCYPLLLASERNNIDKVKLLIDYSNKKNIILKINEQNKIANYYPLLWQLMFTGISQDLCKLLIKTDIFIESKVGKKEKK